MWISKLNLLTITNSILTGIFAVGGLEANHEGNINSVLDTAFMSLNEEVNDPLSEPLS